MFRYVMLITILSKFRYCCENKPNKNCKFNDITMHRRSMSIVFLKGLLENKVGSSALFTLVNFKISLRIAPTTVPFHTTHFNTTYEMDQLVNRVSHANADPSFV